MEIMKWVNEMDEWRQRVTSKAKTMAQCKKQVGLGLRKAAPYQTSEIAIRPVGILHMLVTEWT